MSDLSDLQESKVQVTRKAKLGKRQTSPTNSEKQIAGLY